MHIDPGAATPLYQQVAADIRRRIVSGALPIGGQLPPHRELATRYGVSVITINKALAGLVSEGILRSRVGQGTFVAMRPPVAPQPRQGGVTIGFVLRDLSSPYFSLVAHGAQQRADELGFGLLFASSSNRLDREDEQLRRFRDLGTDGLIIVSMNRTYRLTESIQALHDARYPFVMASYTAEHDVPFVGSDLDRAGYLATQHLISLGRRRIGYIGDRVGSDLFEVRAGGYRRALREHALPVDPALAFQYPFEGEWNDYRSGYALGERLAAMPDRPDGMFVFNDLGALGLQDGLLDRGVRVPEDVAIVGLDDIELAARARVPLTTVKQPTDRIGALAVDMVLARIRGEAMPARRFFEPTLVVRQSCGAGLVIADEIPRPERPALARRPGAGSRARAPAVVPPVP